MKPQVQLLQGEKLLFDCSPRKNLILYLMLVRPMPWLKIIVIVLFAGYIFNKFRVPYYSGQEVYAFAFMMAAAVFGVSYFYHYIIVSRYWYFFTDQRCIAYSGFIGINKAIISYDRIANVNTSQNTLSAFLGLTNVSIDERLAAFPRTTIFYGLTEEDAANVVLIVSKHIAA